MPEARLFTECGLPGISRIPYGIHMCQLYAVRDELAAALVPYFAAGLRNRERCIWVAAPPLPAAEAAAELRGTGIDLDGALESGALTLLDYSDWYAENEKLKGVDVVKLWLAEEERALAAGYAGLRITGNVSFVGPADWGQFMEYEALVDRSFAGRRIVTLCTYPRDIGAASTLDVLHRHTCALERPDQGWQILTHASG